MLPGKDQTVILHPVPVEEPDGYRGRRRRFFMTRKGGGVALPALLIAASVVVVLIVIGVAEMLPRGAVGQIPQGGGNGPVADGGDGQPSRTFYVKVNGGAPSQVALTSNTTSWSTPLSVTVQIALGAGTNTIMFYNPTADAPDLDRVTV